MALTSYSNRDLSTEKPPLVIPRSQHPISRKMIDAEALKVLYRLHHHGFLAYLVGGSVRDLLLGKVPNDFDVATNARPHEIKSLFKNSRIIGRRFRLVHIFFRGGKIIEVSTFRSRSEFEEVWIENGEILRNDSFGTPEEDALRRDITINGLFYNIADFSIIDYVGGMEDLRRGLIRIIGDPDERFRQDPVRMIRVIRHASRTGFRIDGPTYEAIRRHRDKIRKCSPSRLRDEFLRDLKEGSSHPWLALMLETGLLFSLFPDLERAFGEQSAQRERNRQFFLALFALADRLINEKGAIPEPVLIALFLAPFIQSILPEHAYLGEKERYDYRIQTTRWALHQVLSPFSFPKGWKEEAFQILITQPMLERAIQRGGIPKRLRRRKCFREAILFNRMLAEARGEKVSSRPSFASRVQTPHRRNFPVA